MVKIYVQSKRECPPNAVLREGERGGLYYTPDERGSSSEVGGNINSFESLLDGMSKRRVYVENPNEVPEEYTIQEGQQGGYYYETQTNDSNDIDPQNVVQITNDIVRNFGETTARMFVDQLSTNMPEIAGVMMSTIESLTMSDTNSKDTRKRRVYVNDPNDVPEQYEIQEGAQGGYYYETGSDYGSSSEQELEELRSYLMDQHQAAREDPSTADNDELMRDILDTVMEIDNELMERIDKQTEVEEGLSWTEEVRVDEVNEEDGEVVMMDTLSGSTWVEDMDQIEAKLEELQVQEHDYVYEIVAGQYPQLEAEDVHEMIHTELGMEVDRSEVAASDEGLRSDWNERLERQEDPCEEGYTMVGTKPNGNPRCVPEDGVDNYDPDKSQKRRVYVDSPDEVPEEFDVQEGDRGGYYYETGTTMGFSGEVPWDSETQNVAEGISDDLASETVDGGAYQNRDNIEVVDMAEEAAREYAESADIDEEMFVEEVREQTESQIDSYNNMMRSEKERVYIGDPSEAPEGVNVEEGQQGGYYYETGDVDDVDVSDVSGEEFVSELNEEEMYDVAESAQTQVMEDYSDEELSDVDNARDAVYDEMAQVLNDEYGVDIMDFEGEDYDAVTEELDEYADEHAQEIVAMIEEDGT